MRRGKPWAFGLLSLLLAMGMAAAWGVFVTLRITHHGDRWPAGQVWTNPEQGTTFQVLTVSEVPVVRASEIRKREAPAGSGYLVWGVQGTGVLPAPEK